MSATGLLLLRSFISILPILVLNANGQVNPPPPSHIGVHRRFEYKYSFKPPYLAQKDGTVPFWEYGGSKYTTITTKKRSILTTPDTSEKMQLSLLTRGLAIGVKEMV